MSDIRILNRKDSILAPYIHNFIRLKQNIGYKAIRIECGLFAFDRFAKEKGNKTLVLPKELVEEWCRNRPNEKISTWSHRINHIRQFSTYLFNLGYDAYIPPLPNARRENFVPYIYSDEEINAIISACDSLVQQRAQARVALFPVPAMIRMLIGTGIRLGEAVNLLDSDVNLEQNYLVLKACKNGKDRIVPMSESLAEICHQYRQYRSLLPYIHSNTFFVKMDGCKCTNESFGHWWYTILKNAGIKHLGKERGPRMHDLRHTFCVKTMTKMAKEGKDLYYILPILSTYVGHQSLAATDQYVRMTSEMFPELLSQTDSICSYIYPDLKRF